MTARSGPGRSSARSQHRRRRPAADDLARLQRDRLIAATIEAVEADGYAGLSVTKVIERAKSSRRTFYSLFRSREDCFLAALDRVLAAWRALAIETYAERQGWRDGMRAATFSVLSAIDADPGLARLCVVESLAAGRRVLHRRERALRELASAIDKGLGAAEAYGGASREPARVVGEARRAAKDPAALRQAIAATVAGGAVATVHARLCARATPACVELTGELMSAIVQPYLGWAAASEELAASRPSPAVARPRPRHSMKPLQTLEARLTYRTVRVLAAIAESPGANNREIARSGGIRDQGQIS